MKWISVKDRLPLENQVVIIGWDEIYQSTPVAVFINGQFERYIDKMPGDRLTVYYYSNPSHWMPLPAKPNNTGE